jgi:hypothetical protein
MVKKSQEDEIKEVIISKEKYAILKSQKVQEGAFVNIIDKNEITVIVSQDSVDHDNIIEMQKDFRLLTFNMILPFNVVGFISKISEALAKEKIPLFVISAYTTDHILLKEEYLNQAVKALAGLGFKVKK